MLFHVCLIVSRDDIQPILDRDGQPALYNQYYAVSLAKEMSADSGLRYQPRPVKSDENWRERELARFADGTYERLPWDIGGIYAYMSQHIKADTFPHVSRDKPGYVAFTASEEHGQADRQTRIRPGRFLEQYMSGALSARDIELLANDFAAQYEPLELKFASEPDDIERVYLKGPSSCMSHMASDYDSSIHPVRAYGAGDLAIAYLEIGERITARAVAWPEKKVYSRIYGDGGRLQPLLESAGYSCQHDVYRALTGARLLRIEEDDGGFVLPYLDYQSRARDDGSFIVIDPSGPIICESTCGVVRNRLEYTCDHCEEECDEVYDVYVYRARTRSWCENCRDNDANYCDDISEYVISDYTVSMYGGNYHWSQWGFESNGATCEATDENVSADDSVTLDDGTVWCHDYFHDHGVTINGRHYDRDYAPEPEEESEIPEVHTPRPSTASERMAAIAAGQTDLEDFIRANRAA